MSNLFVQTMREFPSDAEVISHKMLARAGYIKKLTSGVYTYLPLMWRVLKKVENIVRDEMDKAGAWKMQLAKNMQDVGLDIDMNTFSNLVSQGINVFNLSDPFYTDICFLYNSIQNNPINNKDIALKDRILVYFPNVTLCEDDCEIRGVNMTTYRAICECSYSKSKDILKDNALYQSQVGQFEELLSSSNIYVIKCLKNIFKVNYFKQCLGGIVILVILILEIICTIFYGLKGFN